jgi:roadblock/LC7 domain-containing protein
MKNLPREKKERIALIAIGSLVVLIAAWYGMIGAQKRKLAESLKNVGEQQTRVDNGHRLLTAKADVERRVAACAQKLENIEADMATGDMYSWIILKVNKFKAGYKVAIPQFSREVTGEVGVLPKFPYKAATFNVRGSAYFHDFGKFLADFENTFPYLRVQNLELEPAGTTSATSTEDPEKIAFRMEIVALINPNTR